MYETSCSELLTTLFVSFPTLIVATLMAMSSASLSSSSSSSSSFTNQTGSHTDRNNPSSSSLSSASSSLSSSTLTLTSSLTSASVEEKMDDSGFWTSPSRRGLLGSGSGHSVDQQSAMYSQLLRELSLFVTQKEETCSNHLQLPHKKKTKVEVSADAERLLRDAVAAFSDARPPANFVVYEDTSLDMNSNGGGGGGGGGGSEAGAREAIMEGPPLFDGSVANATPQTGGAGTILHLACALDEPLCLAFGLAMGADARACHTAFRRLMIHEAACNGSIQCLTLLLELGRQYGGSLPSGGQEGNDADAKLPPRLSRHARTFELPFLPRRLDRSQVLAPLHMYALQGAPPHPTMPTPSFFAGSSSSSQRGSFLGGNKPKKKQHPTPNSNSSSQGPDFLTLLHTFRLCARQVKNGELSELDAARKVLQLATLSESSKTSLSRSCAFSGEQQQQQQQQRQQQQHPADPEFLLRNRGRNNSLPNSNNSDGHGNTPLHWAAFKNETECVSLLLAYGANPNARAHPSGWTPLHDAAYSNSMEAVQLLIDAGAQVDARANSGATPLCFAAQEDSARSAALLLERGADLSARCAGGPLEAHGGQSRFSGYTPLHYCAHYNAKNAARVLLRHHTAHVAMEIPDLNDRLPIHVAVARGSSAVLQELLHAGARVVTRFPDDSSLSASSSSSPLAASPLSRSSSTASSPMAAEPLTPRNRGIGSHINNNHNNINSGANAIVVSTPVSSPVLRSMIPSQPVQSSKPWNCLTQKSIDECQFLIRQAEQHWSPERHSLFTPADRQAVMTLLLTGKRLEQLHGVFVDLWPQVLSYCGRGWFDLIDPSQAPTVILPDPSLTKSASLSTSRSALYYNTRGGQRQATDDDDDDNDGLSLPNL